MKKNFRVKFTKFVSWFICFLMILVSFPASLKADTIDDKRKQIEELQRQIQTNRDALAQKSAQVNSLNNQVDILEGQIREAELQIARTQTNIEQNQAEIDKLQSQIKQKEEELKLQQANLGETVKVMYETGDQGMVEIVVSSNSLSDILDRTQYLESLRNKISTTVNEIKSIKADLESKKNEQEKKRQELTDLLGQQENSKRSLAEQRTNKDQLLSQTKGEEANYQNLVAQKLAEWEQSNAELRRMEGGSIGVAGSYPVPYWPMNGRLGVPFGASGCEAYFCGRTHTGIDIIAPPLTEIRAAKDGTVIDTVNWCADFGPYDCGGGYGNRVKVRHDDGYIAIYGHMSTGTVRVSVGQRVVGGATVLGQEGSSGFSTGYHLHFEVRNLSGIPVGPALP